MTNTIPFYLWGAGGMLAGEFLRLTGAHPTLRCAALVTRTGGEPLSELHPHLAAGDEPRACRAEQALAELERVLREEDVRPLLVLALPHGEAATIWMELSQALGTAAVRLRVLDLSADHRLCDPADYPRWYGSEHAAPGELARFAYGLPELSQGVSWPDVQRIAAPGCFATALQLACVPAARAELLSLERAWIFHGVTGSSGSGRNPKATTHHPFRDGNLWAYAFGGHRHEAELLQALPEAPQDVVFVPHSGPFVRGIHLTAYLPLACRMEQAEAFGLYRETYAERPFVEVLDEAPELRRVVGSNRAALTLRVQGELLVISLVIDNLLKGGSGQALQALNLALSLPETSGLEVNGWGVA